MKLQQILNNISAIYYMLFYYICIIYVYNAASQLFITTL